MQALVTGGAGFVGPHLVAALLARGDAVRVLDRPSENLRRLGRRGVAIYEGDILDPKAVRAAMFGVDAVFHLAALSSVWRSMQEYCEVNVTGTENVCRAVLATGVQRLVHMSSWTVYGMGLTRPAREDDDLDPLNEPYSISKTIGDRLVQWMVEEEGLPAVIMRPDTIFGPGDRVHIGRMADRLRAGRSIVVGSGRNTIPFVYVSDVVNGLLLAVDRESAVGEAFNLGSDDPLTQQELLDAIAHEVGAEPPRVHVPYHALYAAAVMAERVALLTRSRRAPLVTRLGVTIFGAHNPHAIDKAGRRLGYRPAVPVLEGVREAARWYRSEYMKTGAAAAAAGA